MANTLIKIAITASESDDTYKYLDNQSTIIKVVVESMLNKNTGVVHPNAHAQNQAPTIADGSLSTEPPLGDAPNMRVEANENEGSRTNKMSNTKKKEYRDHTSSHTKLMLVEKRKKRKSEKNPDSHSVQGPSLNRSSQGRGMHLVPWGVQYMQPADTAPMEILRKNKGDVVEANRCLSKHLYGVYVPVVVPYIFPQYRCIYLHEIDGTSTSTSKQMI